MIQSVFMEEYIKMKELSTGLKGNACEYVTEKNTALAAGSGSLPVYATPALLALAENAAAAAVDECLPPELASVGVKAAISHLAATPIGVKVTASAELRAIDDRKLTFAITVYDEYEKIGEGTHERFLVKKDRFLAKAEKKQR